MSKSKYGLDQVKLIFRDTAKNKEDLKVKLLEDRLNQTKFFQLCLKAYLKDDPNMRNVLGLMKTEEKIQSQAEQKKLTKATQKAEEAKAKFGIDDDDIDDVFDLIELEGLDV